MSHSRVALSLSIAALVAGCATSADNHISRSKTSATIIVQSDGKVDQETVELCARNGLTGTGVAVPSQILWIANDTSAVLTINFPDTGQNCLRGLHCSGNTCDAITNTNVHGGNTQCTYTVSLNGTVTDPIVIVDDCCP